MKLASRGGERNEPGGWRSHPLVSLLVAGCLGISFDRLLADEADSWFWCWWILAIATWFAWWLTWRRGHLTAASCLLLICVGSSMALWHHRYWRFYPADHLVRFATEEPIPVALRCRVRSATQLTPLPDSDPLSTIPRGASTRFLVEATGLRYRGVWCEVSGRVTVWVNGQLLAVRPGDRLQVFGDLSTIQSPRNPGERDRSIAERSERILCRLSVPYPDCVTVLEKSPAGPISGLGRLRATGLQLLDKYVGAPRSVLAGALLLGARDRLEPTTTEMFFHTGTIHLLAISGLHVGILAGAFFYVARRNLAPRNAALLLTMILAAVYCVVTGMRAPVLRAAVLVQVVCLGLIWRRQRVAYNALAAAALMVLVLRPTELFRTGAQLSFLAVATLIWISRHQDHGQENPLDRLIYRARPWYERALIWSGQWLWRLASAGLAVWWVTLPLVMLHFHLLSPIALALNVILAFPIALGLLSGFGVLLCGWVAPPLAKICGTVCAASLSLVEVCVDRAHHWPGSYAWVAGPPPVWCLVFYIGLAVMIFVPQFCPRRSWAVAWFLSWLSVPSGIELIGGQYSAEAPLRCTFLSVGHGTCVVIELPDGRVLAYDAGRMGSPKTGCEVISQFLWYRGITHLDALVISHADADHYNAVPELLRRFSLNKIFVSPVMFRDESPGVEVLRTAIETNKVQLAELVAGDKLPLGDETCIEVLHPLSQGVFGSDNANSLVLAVSHQGRVILLPGDLEPPGLQDVMAELPYDCDVLMAPHHGSLRSAPADFTRWCSPEYVVISGGHDSENNSWYDQTFAGLNCRVLHTARDGAVTVTVNNGELRVESFLFADPATPTAPRAASAFREQANFSRSLRQARRWQIKAESTRFLVPSSP